MGNARQLSRTSLRGDQVLEVQFSPWPEPPPEMLRLPGVASWWAEMKLVRERDMQTFHRFINNLGIATSTP